MKRRTFISGVLKAGFFSIGSLSFHTPPQGRTFHNKSLEVRFFPLSSFPMTTSKLQSSSSGSSHTRPGTASSQLSPSTQRETCSKLPSLVTPKIWQRAPSCPKQCFPSSSGTNLKYGGSLMHWHLLSSSLHSLWETY